MVSCEKSASKEYGSWLERPSIGFPSALLSEITSTSTTEALKSVDTHEYYLN